MTTSFLLLAASASWQGLVVILIVLLALSYLLRGLVRKGSAGCSSKSCACEAKKLAENIKNR